MDNASNLALHKEIFKTFIPLFMVVVKYFLGPNKIFTSIVLIPIFLKKIFTDNQKFAKTMSSE